MVEKIEYEGKEAFRCKACGFHYLKRADAEKCEDFCNEKGMCKSEITGKSMERDE